jgi:hypothetical protein
LELGSDATLELKPTLGGGCVSSFAALRATEPVRLSFAWADAGKYIVEKVA